MMSLAAKIARALDAPEEQIDLAAVALDVARIAYPVLDAGPYLRRLDEIAAQVECGRTDPLSVIEALSACLFERLGFHGNRDDYYDPRNSFLNDVLDRRTGIPITLSVVYMEVARRIGLTLCGVGFPGHFLVKHAGDPEIVVDCFHGGRIMLPPDCEERLREVYGRPVALDPAFLNAVSKPQIIIRMLHNLAAIYGQTQQPPEAAQVQEILRAIPGG
jgi:regulator of sirC expression with transglutaminase-like and TPR domain